MESGFYSSGYFIVFLVGETKLTCLFLIMVVTGTVGVRGISLVALAMVIQYIVTWYGDKETCSGVNLYWTRNRER